MEDKLKNQSIERLNVSEEIIKKLNDNSIFTIGELCAKTKTNLINIGIGRETVEDIGIDLQLNGLMLKGTL